jgi:YHS domain-containing protein
LLLRLLALLGLLWTGKQVVKQVSSAFHGQQRVDASKADGEISSDDMVKDPVCQTYIPKTIAIQKSFRHQTYYFCSEECAQTFLEQQRTHS